MFSPLQRIKLAWPGFPPSFCFPYNTRLILSTLYSMAETLGAFASAVTIVGLFKSCIDAFELVQVARHQGTDYNRLLVKFNIEKCRLYTWGQMMELTSTSQDVEPRCLATFQFRDLVKHYKRYTRCLTIPRRSRTVTAAEKIHCRRQKIAEKQISSILSPLPSATFRSVAKTARA